MRSESFQSPELRAAVINYPEFFELHHTNNDFYEPLAGVDYELLELFSRFVPFAYKIVSPKDKQWGSALENSSNWTGMIGMLQRDDADLALCAMTLTDERMNAVDFSFPYSIDRLTFTIKASGKAEEDFVYIHPFDTNVWILTCLSLLIGTIVFSLLRGVSRRWKKAYFLEDFVTSMEILIGSRSYRGLHDTSSRLFASTFLILMRVLAFSYAGVLLSFLMIPLMEYQIKTLHELAKFSERGSVKVTSFSSVKYWIPSALDDPLRELSRNVRENPESAWIDPKDRAVDWILKDYAVINSVLYQFPEIIKTGLKDKVFVSSDSLLSTFSSIALRKGFCCLKRFNEITLRILQAGLYNNIYEKHMFRLYIRAPNHADEPGVRPIELKDIKGLLLVVSGYALATTVLIFEKIVCTKFITKKTLPKRNPKF